MNEDDGIGQAYRDHRAYLVDLAFRMLGDIGTAEDVVQEAFTRLLRADTADIDDERGWLIVVTSRLCLDQIKSARSRRDHATDPGDVEFAGSRSGQPLADPADRVTFDDSLRLALLVVLQRLSPAERVVYVLHDIFQMPFATVAQTVGHTLQACRQLASRARQKIAADDSVRFDVQAAEQREITEKFIAACAGGDLSALLELLAPDAWGDMDYGPGAAQPRLRVAGAENVARNLRRFWSRLTAVSHPLGGQPAMLGFRGRELAAVLVFTMRGDVIETVHCIADPAKLGFINVQLQER